MVYSDKSIRKESVRGGIRAALGFVLTAARFLGARPFGASFAASSFDLLVWRYGGVFLGYLVTGGRDGILYAALTAILFSCALVFRGTKTGEKRLFMPACLFFGVILVKSASLFGDFSASKLALILFEGVFSSGAALLFASARDREEGAARDLAAGLVAVAALSLISPVKKYIGADPAALAASLYVLRAGSLFGGAAGAGAGVFLGAALDLRAGYVPKYCLVYSVGGLLCGVFASSKKGTRFAVWALGCALPAFWTARGLEFILIMAECLITGGAYFLFAEQKTAPEKGGFLRRPSGDALGDTADALLKLGENVTANIPRAPFDPAGAVQRAADAVCRACPRLRVCWSDEYLTTSGVFSGIARAASEKGGFSKESVPSFFLKNCLRADELCAGIEKRLETCRRRRELFDAKTDGEALMKKQYKGVSDLIRDVSQNAGRALCRDRDGIGRVIKAYYPHSRWEAYFDGHRFVIDVYPGASGAEGDGFAAASSLSLAVGCRIEPPERVQTYGGSVLRFVRREKYAAEGAAAVRPKEGEKVSGDSVRRIYTDDGRAVDVMSDGMGTGEAAHETSGAA
ncbi:MAG: hypothetical protein IJS65_05955, partial [Clostridia bacterium]|nr:hypothetical protein [Clostridia bacterium]